VEDWVLIPLIALVGLGTSIFGVIFADWFIVRRQAHRIAKALREAFGVSEKEAKELGRDLRGAFKMFKDARAWFDEHGPELTDTLTRLATMTKSFAEGYPERTPKRIIVETVKLTTPPLKRKKKVRRVS